MQNTSRFTKCATDGAPGKQDDPGTGSGDPAFPASGQAPPSFDPNGTGEVMDAAARRDDDADEAGAASPDTAAQAWDEAMHQAMSFARVQGHGAGRRRRGIRTRPPERPRLARAVATSHDRRRPPRLQLERPQPAFHRRRPLPALDPLGGVSKPSPSSSDTSGSLPTDTLALFWTEVREIAAELQPETVALLQVDAVLQDAVLYTSGDLPERVEIKGRGGTDFRPGFAWLSDQGYARVAACT